MIRKIIQNTIGITLILLICGIFVNAQIIPDWSSVTVEPFNLIEPSNIVNPILKASDIDDVNAAFVADPFLFFENDIWYMFFEVLNRDTSHGDIGLATSYDGFHWTYQQVVLDETFHLSYPHVFKWQGEYYMTTELARLYKAVQFPLEWAFIGTLINNASYDSSIFYFNGKLWMFTGSGNHDVLHLFYADNLTGPWTEHPLSPIIDGDASLARPGGRSFVFDNDRIIRIAQKCDVSYGQQVRAFEVDILTETQYEEHEIPESPILTEGVGWNEEGMHQFDPWWTGNYWLCAVDGVDKNRRWSIGIYVTNGDTDSDGVPDYIDGCSNDPNKTQPGACGCGIADTDCDGDGIPDCNIDLAVFVADFGRVDCNNDCEGDFNSDGDVDGSDLAVFAANFGRTDCPLFFEIETRISAGSDDAEEKSSGSVGLNSSDIELVYDGSNQTVGIRFNSVDVPQGATIVNAYVQFKVDETDSAATSLTIEGEDIDNAGTFTSSSVNISSRARTSANVLWSPVPWTMKGEAGPDHRTPDMSQIVQEIVNRSGWSSGNSLAFIITGTGKRVAESYDGDPSGAPLLHLEYTLPVVNE